MLTYHTVYSTGVKNMFVLVELLMWLSYGCLYC